MNREGFYQIAFSGVADSGFGILVFDTGAIVGVDVGGVTYDGTYSYNQRSDEIDASIDVWVPPGVPLVQGARPTTDSFRFVLQASLPRDLGKEKPVRVETPLGPVNVVFKKLRDFPN